MKIKVFKTVAIIDIDGCVCSLNDTANKQRAEQGLSPIPMPSRWDWVGMPEEERDYMLNRCYGSSEFYKKPVPLPYAKNGLWYLSRKHEIVFMTGRAFYQRDEGTEMNQAIADITETWLRRWEMPEHSLVHSRMADKGAVARHLYGDRVAFAVDDSPSAIASYLTQGIFTYVLGYPYNFEYQDGPLTRRVDTFAEIVWHRAMLDKDKPVMPYMPPMPLTPDTEEAS